MVGYCDCGVCVTVMLLICFFFFCEVWLQIWVQAGESAGIWLIHKGPKSGGELVTRLGSYSYDGVSTGIWVIHTGTKSGGEVVTLFDSYSYDG